MSTADKTVRLITDGTVSLDDVGRRLAAHGELVIVSSRPARFVPDDPTFPTTVFGDDGIIELVVGTASDLRLDTYLKQLSSWLGVGLQRIERGGSRE